MRTDAGETRHEFRRHVRIAATQDLYAVARELWERMEESRPIRFVSVTLTELSSASISQLDLFEAGEQRSERVSAVLDELRDRFGDRAVVLGSLLNRGHLAPDRVAFGKLPAGRGDRPT